MKKPCSEMFCLRNQDITDAKAFFIYFLCRTQVINIAIIRTNNRLAFIGR